MVITIDGPAGTGKSTVAQALAQRLKFDFLDTGAMYRAVGLEALRRNANLEDPRELTFIAKHARIDFDWGKYPPSVLLNGDSVGHLLRGGEATRAASYVAVVPAIREMLVTQQQRIGRERKNLVTEGRDQGSVVFPDADVKFFLFASPEVRANRRAEQLLGAGQPADLERLKAEIIERDRSDSTRRDGPLTCPPDAIQIDTSGLSFGEVVAALEGGVTGKLARIDAGGAGEDGTGGGGGGVAKKNAPLTVGDPA